MSGLTGILTDIAGERKTPKGEGKHYIPFTNAEWAVVAAGFGEAPDTLRPNHLKLVIQALASDKYVMVKKADAEAKGLA